MLPFEMLGRSTADLERLPRRWLQHVWGVPDINSRQKWSLCWPTLRRLPRDGIRLLDAGCGSGDWALEISARRKGWTVVGVDRAAASVERAERGRKQLGLNNLVLVNSDFLEYEPDEPFDVVLSVASAHYLVEAGDGAKLFSRFRDWLNGRGLLILFGPRTKKEVPVLPGLAVPPLGEVFSRRSLEQLCSNNGLAIESLEPCIGFLGTVAKQVSCQAKASAVTRIAAYPIELGLMWLDPLLSIGTTSHSCSWRLVAKRAETGKKLKLSG